MKQKLFLKILLGLAALLLCIKMLTVSVIESWLKRNAEAAFNENIPGLNLEIDDVHISLIKAGLRLEGISVQSVTPFADSMEMDGKIAAINIKGLHLLNLLFKSGIDIVEISVSDSYIRGNIPLTNISNKSPFIFPVGIRIARIHLNNINLSINDITSSQSYVMDQGSLLMKGLHVERWDTLSPVVVEPFNFEAQKLESVSAKGNYTFQVAGLNYSSDINKMVAKQFLIKPNYPHYEFASHFKYQTDRIDGRFSDITFHNLCAAEYFKSGTLKSSFMEIGKMDIDVFRDKRKPFEHVKKPAFQEMIYNYPGCLKIDSVSMRGKIVYAELVEGAEAPGSIHFDDLYGNLYNITNDSACKTQRPYFQLKAEALLMGESRMKVLLNAKLFDPDNTFTLEGNLEEMAIPNLNPVLENLAFIYAKTGQFESMHFNFTANNSKASGKMKLFYNNLKIDVLDKQTGSRSGLKQWIQSVIANTIIIKANPTPGNPPREGIIDYSRDPERFLFNYSFKSILSGIQHSLSKESKE